MTDAVATDYKERRLNRVGRRPADWLKDRAVWLLVLGALFQGGAAGLLILQMRWENDNRNAERKAWERQLDAVNALQNRLLDQLSSTVTVLQTQAGEQAKAGSTGGPKTKAPKLDPILKGSGR